MVQMFRMILSLSVSGGLVGLLILLLRPVTKRYFARKWTYYLWLLVLVRLMVPVHVDANVMEYLSRGLAVTVSQQESTDSVDVMAGEADGNVADDLSRREAGVSGADDLSRREADVNVADDLSRREADVNVADDLSRHEADGNVADDLSRRETDAKGTFTAARFFSGACLIWILGIFLSADRKSVV